MQLISSDTNIWIDFAVIDKLYLPFLLPYTYIMHWDAVNKELLHPDGLKDKLLRSGLVGVELTTEEYLQAELYSKFTKLSVYDRTALAIAKCRKLCLLTGDKALRNVAEKESVTVMGTLGILDRLFGKNHITETEYDQCLHLLLANNGKVRLPEAEIKYRLSSPGKLYVRSSIEFSQKNITY